MFKISDIDLSYDHDQPIDTLREKANRLFESQDRVNSVEWDDDGCLATVKGNNFEGEVELRENDVVARIELGPMVRPFRKAIEQQLNTEMESMFDG